MIKLLWVSLLSNIFLWATTTQPQPMELSLLNLGGSLLMVGLLFWSFYKAMKTRNPKYGYVMVLALIMMLGMLFI